MKTTPMTAPIMQLINMPCQEAITKALHDAAPLKFHKRWGIGSECELCGTSELSQRIDETIDAMTDGLTLAPWQRKLATEVLAAKTEEMDAVVDEAAPSPALQAYLEEHELVPDQPEPEADDDLARKTTKELRPLAAAAGMKGARVAKKAEMVEFLQHQGCGCTG